MFDTTLSFMHNVIFRYSLYIFYLIVFLVYIYICIYIYIYIYVYIFYLIAPPYSILFMAEMEEEILRKAESKPYLWWRYTDDIFFLWEHGEEKLKSFYR